MSKVEADSTRRCIIVTGRLYETPIILANIVYALNWDDEAFFSKCSTAYQDISLHDLVSCRISGFPFDLE